MDFFLENDQIRVGIKSLGAELFSVAHKVHNLQYMWNADAAYWAKTSPVLFPIVGTLKSNVFSYRGKQYTLPRHGFAREMDFSIIRQSDYEVEFAIADTPSTLEKYPFHFSFSLIYAIRGSSLQVTYKVKNTGGELLYFSVGGHPAFATPLVKGTLYTDYYFQFNREETAPRWPISKDGLIENTPENFLKHSNKVQLDRDLFYQDAIVLKHLNSDSISLRNNINGNGLDFHFKGFPYLGLWAARNADFVCIEPWCGIADSVDHNQDITMKEGIESLEEGKQWTRSWSVEFY